MAGKLQEAYEKAKKEGKGKQFLKNHPEFAKNQGAVAEEDKDKKKADKKKADKKRADSIQERYEEAQKKGRGDKFLESHPKFAENQGLAPGGGSESTDPVGDATKKVIGDATTYGDEFVEKYLPEGTFQTIDAETSPEMQDLLSRINEYAKTAGNFTDYEQKSLDQLEAGLAGYASPEVQAMREQAMREIRRQYQTMAEAQRINQIQSGTRGAYASAQMQDLNTSRIQAGADLEQDLLIKNADEVQRRKQAFADTVRRTEDARFGRKMGAEGMYGAALSGEEAARTGREMYNAGQAQNEALARSGLALQGAGLYSGVYGSEQAAQAAAEQFNAMLEQNQQWQDFSMKETTAARKQANKRYQDYLDTMGSF